MVSLVSADTVRARLSLPEDDGVIAVIESAISGATSFIESKLRTKVEAGEAIDVFKLDETTLSKDGTYRLMLGNGFLSDTPVVKVGSTLSDIASTVTALKTELEKGLVVIPTPDTFPGYVSVTYTYGFSSTGDVPNWLQEVAMAYTVQLMSMQQINDQKEEMSKIFQMIKSHGVEILDAHLRRDSFSIRPFL